MKLVATPIADLFVIEPKLFGDERGFFMESYNEKIFEENKLPTRWVQDNHSRSSKGVLRGLHQQIPNAQDKLVRVTSGSVWDVAVDLRPDSETFGQHFGLELSAENQKCFFVPKGFAHGFLVLSELADFQYKCSDFYAPADECGIHWKDPELNIAWPLEGDPIVSPKDQQLGSFADYKKARGIS